MCWEANKPDSSDMIAEGALAIHIGRLFDLPGGSFIKIVITSIGMPKTLIGNDRMTDIYMEADKG